MIGRMADEQSHAVANAQFGRRRAGQAISTASDEKPDTSTAAVRAPDGSVVVGGHTDKAAAGWGDGGASEPQFGTSIARQQQTTKQQQSSAPAKHVFASAVERESDTVAIIRDAGDAENVDDLAMRVAAAPRNAGRKVASLKELEQDGGLAALNVGNSRAAGIDLSFLTAVLATPEQLAEADEPWEFDRLLQEVAQDIDAETDKRDVDGAGIPRPANPWGASAAVGATVGAAASGTTAGAGSSMRPVATGATATAGRRAA